MHPFYRFNEIPSYASYIIWSLIGSPIEIGYYSKYLRKLEIVDSKIIPFKITSQEDFEIDIPNNYNLLKNEIMVMSFEYPPTNNEPDLEIKQFNGKFTLVKNH